MKELVVENKPFTISCGIQHNLSPTMHFHTHIEIIYILSGESYATADRKSYKLNKGDMFLAFPNQIHHYKTLAEGEHIVLMFSPSILFELENILFNNVPKTNAIYNVPDNLHDLFVNLLQRDIEYENTLKVGILNTILATVLPVLTLKPRIKTNNTTLQEVLNFCYLNFANDITLDSIADALHISKFHISRLLNKKLGMNFNTYINNLRINHACDMLEDTEISISNISEEVGFGSIRSFNRVFKDIMDKTPLEYRNQFKTLS